MFFSASNIPLFLDQFINLLRRAIQHLFYKCSSNDMLKP